jgi:hypothetical protein
MNYEKFICTLGLVVLAVVMLNGRSAEAETVANGPYYANPSWDQTLPSNTRFIVLSNTPLAPVTIVLLSLRVRAGGERRSC